MNRRTFLKIAGLGSVSFAASCTSESEQILYSLVQAPDDMVTGKATWYASTCRECPSGCGILAKNREGRVVKLEGNPLHPINQGTICMRGQAALQGVYNPDRLRTPLLKENNQWQSISFKQAEAILRTKTMAAADKGPNRVGMMTEVVGDSLYALFSDALDQWKSQKPIVYEPYGYESLKTANKELFGVDGLPSYHLDKADILVSFGADFLETWLSPVEYARKFKAMHGFNKGEKGYFCHISPYQSLTGANADLWIPCVPGGEAAVALGCIKEAISKGMGKKIPDNIRSAMGSVAAAFDDTTVLKASGISAGHYKNLKARLFNAVSPLVLGTSSGATGTNTLLTDMAVNLLNYVLDPDLTRFDFTSRHRVETADKRADVVAFLETLQANPADVLLLNNVNPVFTLPAEINTKKILSNMFVVSFSSCMDETASVADLIFPVKLPLESWDEYGGQKNVLSTIQPAMGKLTKASEVGDVFLNVAENTREPADNYKAYLYAHLKKNGIVKSRSDWVGALQKGGELKDVKWWSSPDKPVIQNTFSEAFKSLSKPASSDLAFLAVPSIRFFDGRGANRPWLCEIPDPLTKIAWQSPVLMHPDTVKQLGFSQEDLVQLQSPYGRVEAPIYEYDGVKQGLAIMNLGQGHLSYGRYAENAGANPFQLLSAELDPNSGEPQFLVDKISVSATGRSLSLASTSGSRIQHGRKIALTVPLKKIKQGKAAKKAGLAMWEFPLTLPLPEGYDKKRDFYPPHDHDTYRWAMIVDLDRCTGCGACSAACYAENNLGIVGVDRVLEGREMAWLSVERYHNPDKMEDMMFLPMMCQHCDNAPCEPVCPVYAPHHSKEGLNNQIYNRCIGTRFCSQNCPYKVRRFNWFEWDRPDPLPLQLNPDVTVRRAGVMEKCSFCIQRIKVAQTVAKNEKRTIKDGEVTPACVQTCPTGALVFGNLMEKESRVRKLVEDPRAYQVMGYINTKPAVIYLKKVVQEI